MARKDLLWEWRVRDAFVPSSTFGLAVLVVLGLVSGGGPEAAAPVLWVSVALAAVLAVGRTAEREGEEGTWEALLLYPGSREDLFWGKWMALAAVMVVLAAGLWCAQMVLFGASVQAWGHFALTVLLAAAGLGAVGTLLAAVASNVRASRLLLPLLFLPTALPVLLAGVRLAEAASLGRPSGPWLGVLLIFDLLFLVLGPFLFEVVVEG